MNDLSAEQLYIKLLEAGCMPRIENGQLYVHGNKLLIHSLAGDIKAHKVDLMRIIEENEADEICHNQSTILVDRCSDCDCRYRWRTDLGYKCTQCYLTQFSR